MYELLSITAVILLLSVLVSYAMPALPGDDDDEQI